MTTGATGWIVDTQERAINVLSAAAQAPDTNALTVLESIPEAAWGCSPELADLAKMMTEALRAGKPELAAPFVLGEVGTEADPWRLDEYAEGFTSLWKAFHASTRTLPRDPLDTLVEGADTDTSEAGDVDPLGELAGAHILEETTGGNLRHSTDRGWLWFDGTRYEPTEKRAKRLAAGVGAERRKRGTLATDDPDRIKGFYRAAKRDESAAGVEATLKLASTLPGIDADHVEFDSDPWALNFLNGTLDLKSGELRPHKREDFNTKIVPHAFDPSATCPRWLSFLDEIFEGDRELVNWLQWLTGYSITGSVHRHLFPVLHGDGRNGKGAFFRAIRHALGTDYAAVVDPEDLMEQRNPRSPGAVAALRGVRFAFAQETTQGRRLNESQIKTLTGGDVLKDRFLYGRAFEFIPTHKIWLATNYRPKVTGTASGLWDRLRLIPFERRFLDHEQDPHLDSKLESEAQGILAWACAGARMQEPPIPACVKAATDEYREESDTLAAFIREVLTEWEHSTTLKRVVYEAYRAYMNNHCEDMRAFNKRLEALGFEEKKTGPGMCWKGIALNAEFN